MINKAILVGRLGKDPECRTAQSGKPICRFTLATDTGYGANKKTDWHTIKCFDRQADYCRNYLHKGSLVYVEGRISYGEYEKDGIKRYTTEIIANSVQGLGGRTDNPTADSFTPNQYDNPSYGGGNQQPAYNQNTASAPSNDTFGDGMGDDSIPF